MRALDVQTAIYDKLVASSELAALATGGIHDHTPQDTPYPYVVIGDDIGTQIDTDDSLDSDHIATIHVWSRERGRTETKEIQQSIGKALHRQPLTVAGATFTDTQLQNAESFLDDDGLIRHGIQRFNVMIDDEVL